MVEKNIPILKEAMSNKEEILYYKLIPLFDKCLCCNHGPHKYVTSVPPECNNCELSVQRKKPTVFAIPVLLRNKSKSS